MFIWLVLDLIPLFSQVLWQSGIEEDELEGILISETTDVVDFEGELDVFKIGDEAFWISDTLEPGNFRRWPLQRW